MYLQQAAAFGPQAHLLQGSFGYRAWQLSELGEGTRSLLIAWNPVLSLLGRCLLHMRRPEVILTSP